MFQLPHRPPMAPDPPDIAPGDTVVLLKYLHACGENWRDKEVVHQYADQALLQYINHPGVTSAFEDIEKWYA